MSSAGNTWTRRGGKSSLSFKFGPTDKQWVTYVIGVSLVNLWVAVAWLLSSPEPLRALATDGSMFVYCTVTMWLTWGALRQELKESHWQPGSYREEVAEVWRRHDALRNTAVVTTLFATVYYAQFIASEPGPSTTERVVCSVVAVLVGAVYSRQAMAAAYDATTLRAAEAT